MNSVTKNIVIAPCGNKSTFYKDAWMRDNKNRDFHVCLLFYHNTIETPGQYEDVEYFYHLKDFKYKMIHKLLTEIAPQLLEEYDYFYFLDDDIHIDTAGINQLFNFSKAFRSSISCASLSHDSYCSWPIFKQNARCILRYVGQIEVMAPLFHKDALTSVLPTFIENQSSWGFDSVWPKLLGYPKNRLIIFDAVVMRHTLPVGGGELYTKLDDSPYKEWEAIVKKYGARSENHREYSRLEIRTDKNLLYKTNKYFSYIRMLTIRKIKDYDLSARIKNRWTMLTK